MTRIIYCGAHKDDEEKQIQITLNRHTGNLIEFRIDDENSFQVARKR